MAHTVTPGSVPNADPAQGMLNPLNTPCPGCVQAVNLLRIQMSTWRGCYKVKTEIFYFLKKNRQDSLAPQ